MISAQGDCRVHQHDNGDEASWTGGFTHCRRNRGGNIPLKLGRHYLHHSQRRRHHMADTTPEPTSVPLYLDDLRVGRRFTSGTHALDERQITAFASEFDPQPFHIDREAAKRTLFRGLVASGWHTAAITMRLQ